MLRDRGLAHRERRAHFEHARVAVGEPGEDRPPRRVREGAERPVELAFRQGHLTHNYMVIQAGPAVKSWIVWVVKVQGALNRRWEAGVS